MIADTAPLVGHEATTTLPPDASSALARAPGRMTSVSVDDLGAGRPTLRDVPPDAVHGRGLAMVHRGALRWGVDEAPTGKEVWFEVSE